MKKSILIFYRSYLLRPDVTFMKREEAFEALWDRYSHHVDKSSIEVLEILSRYRTE